MKADLHLHTNASDGRLAPKELVYLAAKEGLDVIAITDHDIVDGIVPALAAAHEISSSLKVIPGIEINTDVLNGEVHILGYFIDYTDRALAATLERLRNSRQRRAQKMVSKLDSMGMHIDFQRVQEIAQSGSICRPHVAEALLEKGYVISLKEAFNNYIGREGPAYVEREKILPVEAVELIASSHGLPVLAHPADIKNLESVISELKSAGLAGMEVFYGKYSLDVIDKLLNVAEKYNLIPTGGTDYHAFGDGLEVMIGDINIPSESVDRLFAIADKNNVKLMQ